MLAIETDLATDYAMLQLDSDTATVVTGSVQQALSGRFAVASVQAGQVAYDFSEPAPAR